MDSVDFPRYDDLLRRAGSTYLPMLRRPNTRERLPARFGAAVTEHLAGLFAVHHEEVVRVATALPPRLPLTLQIVSHALESNARFGYYDS